MKNKKSITILMVAFTLASCQSYKRVPYLQSYESLTDKGYNRKIGKALSTATLQSSVE